jgi:hypothetical protein
MKRIALTLFALAAVGTTAVLACPPATSYSRHVGYSVGYAAVSYAQPTVSIVNPYTPTVQLQASYAPVAAAPCVCEQPQVAAPAAYEQPLAAAPMVQSYARVAAPSVSYAAVAAPAVSYTPTVAVAAGYSSVRVGAGYHVGAGRVAVVRAPVVRVAAVRVHAAPAVKVKVVQQRRGILGRIGERIRARRG